MLKKVLIGLLGLTVVGAGSAAIAYQVAQANSASTPHAEVARQERRSQRGGLPEYVGGRNTAVENRGQGNQRQGAARSNHAGYANGSQNGNHVPEAQVDEWVTIEGEITALSRNSITIQTADGEVIGLQAGSPGFLESQGVALQLGDEVSVLGFYENGRFMTGEITQLSTGLQIMLRDSNGRPLWAGPGGPGNANGNRRP